MSATTDVLEKVKIPPTDHLTVRFILRSRLERLKKYKICDSFYCTSVLPSPQKNVNFNKEKCPFKL